MHNYWWSASVVELWASMQKPVQAPLAEIVRRDDLSEFGDGFQRERQYAKRTPSPHSICAATKRWPGAITGKRLKLGARRYVRREDGAICTRRAWQCDCRPSQKHVRIQVHFLMHLSTRQYARNVASRLHLSRVSLECGHARSKTEDVVPARRIAQAATEIRVVRRPVTFAVQARLPHCRCSAGGPRVVVWDPSPNSGVFGFTDEDRAGVFEHVRLMVTEEDEPM